MPEIYFLMALKSRLNELGCNIEYKKTDSNIVIADGYDTSPRNQRFYDFYDVTSEFVLFTVVTYFSDIEDIFKVDIRTNINMRYLDEECRPVELIRKFPLPTSPYEHIPVVENTVYNVVDYYNKYITSKLCSLQDIVVRNDFAYVFFDNLIELEAINNGEKLIKFNDLASLIIKYLEILNYGEGRYEIKNDDYRIIILDIYTEKCLSTVFINEKHCNLEFALGAFYESKQSIFLYDSRDFFDVSFHYENANLDMTRKLKYSRKSMSTYLVAIEDCYSIIQSIEKEEIKL